RNSWYFKNGYDRWPFTNFEAWQEHVRRVARDAKAKNLKGVWEIWNEPDSKLFWQGTREQYCETFVRAAKILREELGNDLEVSGPSLAQYDQKFIAEFLDYCKQRRIRVDVLCWHEFTDHDIPAITDRLLATRQLFVNNPAYRGLGIKKIHINEIV